jgi:hypothetical protein
MGKPWDHASGWEYDQLRDLPPDEQERVWSAAMGRAIRTWWVHLIVFVVCAPLGPLHLFGKVVAGALGGGWVGVVASITFFVCVDYLYLGTAFSYFPSLVRPFIRQELALHNPSNRQ